MSKPEIMPGYFWRAATGMVILAALSLLASVVQRVPPLIIGSAVALWVVAGITFLRAAKIRRSIDMEPIWEHARSSDTENFHSEMRKTVGPRFVVLGWVTISVASAIGAFLLPALYLANR